MTATPAELCPTPNDIVEIGQLQYGEQEYRVTVGRDPELVEKIIEGSREDIMQRMVPKDVAERFRDEKSFEEWYAKGRFLVSYRDMDNNLAAIVWFGASSLTDKVAELQAKSEERDLSLSMQFSEIEEATLPEGCNDTFAIRVYDGFRSQPKPDGEDASLARRFMEKGQFLYESVRQGNGEPVDRIWLETNVSEDGPGGEEQVNRAIFLYQKAGYTAVATYMKPDAKRREMRVIMVTEPYATRSIGTFVLAGAQPSTAEA